MVWVLSILCGVFFLAACFFGWKSYRFATMIMVLEDDFSDLLEVMNYTEGTLKSLVHKPVFFDSEEIKHEYNEALDTVKMAQFEVNRVSAKFVERSKQKYVWEIEEDEPEQVEQSVQSTPPWDLSPEVKSAMNNKNQIVPVNQKPSGPKHVFPLFKGRN